MPRFSRRKVIKNGGRRRRRRAGNLMQSNGSVGQPQLQTMPATSSTSGFGLSAPSMNPNMPASSLPATQPSLSPNKPQSTLAGAWEGLKSWTSGEKKNQPVSSTPSVGSSLSAPLSGGRKSRRKSRRSRHRSRKSRGRRRRH